ncbi:MAG: hypothetical protein EBX40_07045 [Gammaproteobacteria bacterium]|nr:hypothetical protein [Gammaproteobacteria bacterium]
MKIALELPDSIYFVRRYTPAEIVINNTAYGETVVLHQDALITDFNISSVHDLSPIQLEKLAARAPKTVILGTGTHQVFPDRALLKPFINAQIGVEIMSTQAAAKTYNILAAEGRNVMAILILDPTPHA